MLKLLIRALVKKTKSRGNLEENDGVKKQLNLPRQRKQSVPNNRVLSILNETSEPVNTPSPKLTYAEKDRKDLEAKLHKLQSEQQQALENAKKKLEEEKQALVEREKKFEDERKAKLEALEEEKRKAIRKKKS